MSNAKKSKPRVIAADGYGWDFPDLGVSYHRAAAAITDAVAAAITAAAAVITDTAAAVSDAAVTAIINATATAHCVSI